MIFASTAPGQPSSSLLSTPEAERRATTGAGELADAAEHDDQERVDDVALAEVGPDVADLRERARRRARRCRRRTRRRSVSMRAVSTPTQDAMRRFCVTPRTNRPSRVLRDQQRDAAEHDAPRRR